MARAANGRRTAKKAPHPRMVASANAIEWLASQRDRVGLQFAHDLLEVADAQRFVMKGGANKSLEDWLAIDNIFNLNRLMRFDPTLKANIWMLYGGFDSSAMSTLVHDLNRAFEERGYTIRVLSRSGASFRVVRVRIEIEIIDVA